MVASVVVGVGWSLAGAGLWTLGEYLLHRLDMHRARGRGATSREHQEHHATLDVPVRSIGTWSGAAIVGVALGGWVHPALGLGWLAGYGTDDTVHRAIHARAPGGAYGRLVRRHHLSHHFGQAGSDYGITSPVWDVVFRTRSDPGIVRVPAAQAPPWVTAADPGYELVGGPR